MSYKKKPMSEWSVDDMCEFLEKIDLDSAIPAFKQNGVDGKLFATLSDDDMTAHLGLGPLQVRKLRMEVEQRTNKDGETEKDNSTRTTNVNITVMPGASVPQLAHVLHPTQPGPALPSAPPMHMAPVQHVAAPPPVDVSRYAHASSLLNSASGKLREASSLIQTALTTQSGQTGARIVRGGRRRNTLLGTAINATQRSQTVSADAVTDEANRLIKQARNVCPDLPPISSADVDKVGGIVTQSVFNGIVSDTVRLSKLRGSLDSINATASQVQSAIAFCHGRMTAHPPTHGHVQPPIGYPRIG